MNKKREQVIRWVCAIIFVMFSPLGYIVYRLLTNGRH